MFERLTAAEAWALAARMWRLESDAAADEWPRQADSHQRYVDAAKRALDASERSVALDASDGVLKRALAKWSTPVQPAAHYATPMSAADKRRALASAKLHALAEKCGPLPCSMLAVGTKPPRRPTKRRGTKPSSLPNRLAAACHTLKEP